MLVGNRLARIIFGAFILIILVLNFLWWVAPKGAVALVGHDPSATDGIYTLKGFNWFFNHVSKYPGIQPLINEINNLDMNFTDNTNAWDNVLDILKAMVIPIKALWGIISTVWQNLVWLLGFVGAMFY